MTMHVVFDFGAERGRDRIAQRLVPIDDPICSNYREPMKIPFQLVPLPRIA